MQRPNRLLLGKLLGHLPIAGKAAESQGMEASCGAIPSDRPTRWLATAAPAQSGSAKAMTRLLSWENQGSALSARPAAEHASPARARARARNAARGLSAAS